MKTRLCRASNKKERQTDRHSHYSEGSDNVRVCGVLSVSDAHADVRGPQTKGVLWWWISGSAAVSIRTPTSPPSSLSASSVTHQPYYLTILCALDVDTLTPLSYYCFPPLVAGQFCKVNSIGKRGVMSPPRETTVYFVLRPFLYCKWCHIVSVHAYESDYIPLKKKSTYLFFFHSELSEHLTTVGNLLLLILHWIKCS